MLQIYDYIVKVSKVPAQVDIFKFHRGVSLPMAAHQTLNIFAVKFEGHIRFIKVSNMFFVCWAINTRAN